MWFAILGNQYLWQDFYSQELRLALHTNTIPRAAIEATRGIILLIYLYLDLLRQAILGVDIDRGVTLAFRLDLAVLIHRRDLLVGGDVPEDRRVAVAQHLLALVSQDDGCLDLNAPYVFRSLLRFLIRGRIND